MRRVTTGTVFVDLSAAYDTVNHIVLLTKLYWMTENVEFTKHHRKYDEKPTVLRRTQCEEMQMAQSEELFTSVYDYSLLYYSVYHK